MTSLPFVSLWSKKSRLIRLEALEQDGAINVGAGQDENDVFPDELLAALETSCQRCGSGGLHQDMRLVCQRAYRPANGFLWDFDHGRDHVAHQFHRLGYRHAHG